MEKSKSSLPSFEERFRRSLLLIITIAFPPLAVIMSKFVADPDIWWHLRTAEWIVEHGAVPLTEPFSIHGQGQPWVAYSWLFELLVYGLDRWLGLPGIVCYSAFLSLAIAAAMFALVNRMGIGFIASVVLTILCLGAMLPALLTPRPWLFTILFFIIELDILLTVRRTGNHRYLWLLPPLFALWANIHIQFVYGFILLGLAASEFFINHALRRFGAAVEGTAIVPARIILAAAACVAATLVNPYHYQIYLPVIDYIRQSEFYNLIAELQALRFRSISDWLLLGAAAAAAFTLGWRRSTSPFLILLLLAGLFFAFRARRDMWFVATASAAVIAASLSSLPTGSRYLMTRAQILCVAVAVGILLLIAMRVNDVSQRSLEMQVAETFPVAAAALVEERGYAGPLYNHFDWGGYLIWRLRRLPVAMDGRSNVYGPERAERSYSVWGGKAGWESDPEFTSSRLVIAQREQPLASLLKLDPRFELVYEDTIAAVFVARPLLPPQPAGHR